jgi:hypothetical protein
LAFFRLDTKIVLFNLHFLHNNFFCRISTKSLFLAKNKTFHKSFVSLKHFFPTLGVNFIKVLRTAFALVDPESVKNIVKSSVSFYALGSTGAKAACRTLMKLTADRGSEIYANLTRFDSLIEEYFLQPVQKNVAHFKCGQK